MPRDDLSIDWVKSMPQAEPLDPGLILDDWVNRVQNLPEEIRHIHEEILDKDRHYNESVRLIEDRDAKIQKWIKTNGSHEPNPKEELLRAQIREQYVKADQLSQEKIALTQRLQLVMDKHLRSLDIQVKLLYDRAEPGFTDPDEVPSLLRPSAANHTAPSVRAINPASNITNATAMPHHPVPTSSNPALARLPSHAQVRSAQAQQAQQKHQAQLAASLTQVQHQHPSSAPTTPAASIVLNRQREGSAGPATKRGPRVSSGLGSVPATSSNLARHASLGPGTPKGGANAGAGGVARAGSAGPRASSVKSAGGSRRNTPTAVPSRKKPPKSSLSRVKKASNRNSPASTAESDLSDAESGSNEEDDAPENAARGMPNADGKDADGDDPVGDAEDDEEEDDEEEEDGADDKKYCICHNVSYGDMVACDNDNCPYEWFHWACVGLKSEPNGTWYCPPCTEENKKKGK